MRFAHGRVISRFTDVSLNAFYYTLKTNQVNHREWDGITDKKALSVVHLDLDSCPLFLSIDDTLIEKFGQKLNPAQKPSIMLLATVPVF